MEISRVLEQTVRQLADTTGLKPVAVIGASHEEQGWRVRVEMLEMARIPTATDVLGDYEVLLDEDGSMLRFERKRTRLRAEPVASEA
ncbi:MAG: gas vesicle protein [Chloroflexi bacterium]|nr:gas vesicle protein [Chloroflexota bacterium]